MEKPDKGLIRDCVLINTASCKAMEYERWDVEQVKVLIEEEFGEEVARKCVGKPYILSEVGKQCVMCKVNCYTH